MLIFKALQYKNSLFWGILITISVLVWPVIPLRGLDVWSKTLIGLFPTNIGYPILAFLIGIYTAIFVYSRKNPGLCPAKKGKSGIFGGVTGVFLGACPACIPVITLFLPLSLTITLSYYSWIFLSLAIIVLIFAIYRMGGFKKVESRQN